MRINTRGLSRRETKPSKQSSPAILSLTKAFLNNTDNYLAYNYTSTRRFHQEVLTRLHNKHAKVHEDTGYPSRRTPMGVTILE